MTHLYAPTEPEPETRFECVCGWVYYDSAYQVCRECEQEL